jgi:hypothetical protein
MCGNTFPQGMDPAAVNGNYEALPKNCWDFWKCAQEQKHQCRVYRKKLGRTCWYVPFVFRAEVERSFDTCGDCPWYKMVNTIQ